MAYVFGQASLSDVPELVRLRIGYLTADFGALDPQQEADLWRELPALEKMLWGGTLMLIVDHFINGELTWRFPFFTALGLEGGGAVMLREMLTVGVPMALVLTAAWAVWALAKERKARLAA